MLQTHGRRNDCGEAATVQKAKADVNDLWGFHFESWFARFQAKGSQRRAIFRQWHIHLSQQLPHHFAAHVGEAEVAALETERQLLVIDAEAMQERRVEIVN